MPPPDDDVPWMRDTAEPPPPARSPRSEPFSPKAIELEPEPEAELLDDESVLGTFKTIKAAAQAAAASASAAVAELARVIAEQDAAVGVVVAKRNALVIAATTDAAVKHAAAATARAAMDAAAEKLIADLKAQE